MGHRIQSKGAIARHCHEMLEIAYINLSIRESSLSVGSFIWFVILLLSSFSFVFNFVSSSAISVRYVLGVCWSGGGLGRLGKGRSLAGVRRRSG